MKIPVYLPSIWIQPHPNPLTHNELNHCKKQKKHRNIANKIIPDALLKHNQVLKLKYLNE